MASRQFVLKYLALLNGILGLILSTNNLVLIIPIAAVLYYFSVRWDKYPLSVMAKLKILNDNDLAVLKEELALSAARQTIRGALVSIICVLGLLLHLEIFFDVLRAGAVNNNAFVFHYQHFIQDLRISLKKIVFDNQLHVLIGGALLVDVTIRFRLRSLKKRSDSILAPYKKHTYLKKLNTQRHAFLRATFLVSLAIIPLIQGLFLIARNAAKSHSITNEMLVERLLSQKQGYSTANAHQPAFSWSIILASLYLTGYVAGFSEAIWLTLILLVSSLLALWAAASDKPPLSAEIDKTPNPALYMSYGSFLVVNVLATIWLGENFDLLKMIEMFRTRNIPEDLSTLSLQLIYGTFLIPTHIHLAIYCLKVFKDCYQSSPNSLQKEKRYDEDPFKLVIDVTKVSTIVKACGSGLFIILSIFFYLSVNYQREIEFIPNLELTSYSGLMMQLMMLVAALIPSWILYPSELIADLEKYRELYSQKLLADSFIKNKLKIIRTFNNSFKVTCWILALVFLVINQIFLPDDPFYWQIVLWCIIFFVLVLLFISFMQAVFACLLQTELELSLVYGGVRGLMYRYILKLSQR